MKKRIFLILLPLFVTAVVFSCNAGGSPSISVTDAKLVGKGDAAAFMFITNRGDGSDILWGAALREYPDVRVELHDVENGVMTEIKKLKIPAKKTTFLKAGSHHIMLFGLPDRIEDEITLRLHFEKSGTIEVRMLTKR